MSEFACCTKYKFIVPFLKATVALFGNEANLKFNRQREAPYKTQNMNLQNKSSLLFTSLTILTVTFIQLLEYYKPSPSSPSILLNFLAGQGRATGAPVALPCPARVIHSLTDIIS